METFWFQFNNAMELLIRSLATDGQDVNGSKLENVEPTFHVLGLRLAKNIKIVCFPCEYSLEFLLLVL